MTSADSPSPRKQVTTMDIKRLRQLRSMGLTNKEVANLTGISLTTVKRYSSDYRLVRLVHNEDLRWAFIESGLDAGEVARRLGWTPNHRGSGAQRVRRTLGLEASWGERKRRRRPRRYIDQRIARDLAEAIGVDPKAVGVEGRKVEIMERLAA